MAINSTLSTAAVALSVTSVHGPSGSAITLAICVSSVPFALYLGRIASRRSPFLARIVPAGVGSAALLFNVAGHGVGALIAFSAAICAVFLLTCMGKLLHGKYGVLEDVSDPEDLHRQLAQAEVRHRELLEQIASVETEATTVLRRRTAVVCQGPTAEQAA